MMRNKTLKPDLSLIFSKFIFKIVLKINDLANEGQIEDNNTITFVLQSSNLISSIPLFPSPKKQTNKQTTGNK